MSFGIFAPSPPHTLVLTATAGAPGGTIDLSASDVSTVGIVSRQFQRSDSAGGPWTTIATLTSGATFQDTERPAGVTQYYRYLCTDRLGRTTTSAVYTGAATNPGGGGGGATEFPRRGIYWIGNTSSLGNFLNQYQSVAGKALMAKCDVVIYTDYPEMQAARGGLSWKSIHDDVRAQSLIEPLFFPYYDTDAWDQDGNTNLALIAKANAKNWWLRTSWPSGAYVDSYFATTPSRQTLNPTITGNLDAGLSQPEWHVSHVVNWTMDGGESNTVNAGTAGVFADNWLPKPRVSGDFNEDGTSESPGAYSDTTAGSVNVRQRAGLSAISARFQSLKPTKYLLANFAEWNRWSTGSFTSGSVFDAWSMSGKVHGGLMEHWFGRFFGPEGRSSDTYWDGTRGYNGITAAQLLQDYQRYLDGCLDPKLVLVGAFPRNGQANAYADFRHALAFTLMNNGLLCYCRRDGYGDWDEFDEYAVDRTTRAPSYATRDCLKYLGARIGAPPTAPWQGTVYRAEFEYGYAYWNPPDGTDTLVTHETTVYAIAGTQDTTVNNGGAWNSETIARNDGRIRLKQ